MLQNGRTMLYLITKKGKKLYYLLWVLEPLAIARLNILLLYQGRWWKII